MTLKARAIGALTKDPQKKTTKDGHEFVLARICHDALRGEELTLFAHSEPSKKILIDFKAGDLVQAVGYLKAGIYVGTDGVSRVTLSITVEECRAFNHQQK